MDNPENNIDLAIRSIEDRIRSTLPEEIKPLFDLYVTLVSAETSNDNKAFYNIPQLLSEAWGYLGRSQPSAS